MRNIHLRVDIHGVLSRTDRELKRDHMKWITDGGKPYKTPTEFRVALCKELAAGRLYLPCGCPTPTPLGNCPGHEIDDVVANG